MTFSQELNSVFFPREPADEETVIAAHAHIYHLRRSLRTRAEQVLRESESAPASFLSVLKSLLQKQEELMAARFTRLSMDGILIQVELSCLKNNMTEMSAELASMGKLGEESGLASGLQSAVLRLIKAINELNQEIVRVEEWAVSLYALRTFQAAFAQYFLADNKNELKHVLIEQQGLAAVLAKYIDAIQPVQVKFLAYMCTGNRFFKKADSAAKDLCSPSPTCGRGLE
jgi:hypothetical protein